MLQGRRLSLAARLLLSCAGAMSVLLCRAPEAATGLRLLLDPSGALLFRAWLRQPLVSVLRLLLGPGDTLQLYCSRAEAAAGSSVLRLLFSPGDLLLLRQCRLGLPAAYWCARDGCCTLIAQSSCQLVAEAAAGQAQCAVTDAGLRLPLAEALDLDHSVALPPLNTNRTHFESKPRILVAVTSSSTSDVVSAPLQCPTPHLNTADSQSGLCHSSVLHCSAHTHPRQGVVQPHTGLIFNRVQLHCVHVCEAA